MADEGRFDEVKGRAKEAAGEVSGNPDLEREGKVDKSAGGVKGFVDDLADRVKEMFRR